MTVLSQPSSIDRLEPAIKAEIEVLFASGRTLDEIVQHLRGLLGERTPSRSALHRYKAKWADLRERLMAGRQMAEAFAAELGSSGQTDADQLAIELVSNLASRALADQVATDAEVDALELSRLARTVRQMVLARGNLAETERAIRAELRDRVAAALDAVEREATADSDPMEMIRRIRQDVYGIYDAA